MSLVASEVRWIGILPALLGSLNFFRSHGRQDPILSYQAARDLSELLREAGMVGEFVSFPGGHEIPYEVIDELNRYIDRSI